MRRTCGDAHTSSQQPIGAVREIHLEAIVQRLPRHDSEGREGCRNDRVAAGERAHVNERPVLRSRRIERQPGHEENQCSQHLVHPAVALHLGFDGGISKCRGHSCPEEEHRKWRTFETTKLYVEKVDRILGTGWYLRHRDVYESRACQRDREGKILCSNNWKYRKRGIHPPKRPNLKA